MKTAIVTICNQQYAALLSHWLSAIRSLTDMPVAILCLNGFIPEVNHPCLIIEVSSEGNPFTPDLPDYACAEKLRIFKHLPDIDRILFIDLDAWVIRAFWKDQPYFELCAERFIAAQDFFVGYKEKMVMEFRPYDPTFQMRYLPDGSFYYINTGVFFASRDKHAVWFSKFMEIWKEYLDTVGQRPSIFDQNLINYCLIRFREQIPTIHMPITNNCIRQYEKQTIDEGILRLNGEPISVYHFNGGDAEKKVERWVKLKEVLKKA